MRWPVFIERTQGKPPHELLVRARAVALGGAALDIGAGALCDSIYLAQEGFTVTALDAEPSFLESEAPTGVHRVLVSAEEFKFPHDTYTLVNAQFVLPFVPDLPHLFMRIHESLVPGGVFVGNLFGTDDSWNDGSKSHITFHTTEQARELLSGFDIVHFEQRQRDGRAALVTAKHWHTFEFVVRKRHLVL